MLSWSFIESFFGCTFLIISTSHAMAKLTSHFESFGRLAAAVAQVYRKRLGDCAA